MHNLVFLKTDSITRRSPFPTYRLLGASSPVFNRYYEGAKTASVHFLTSLLARIGYPDVSQWFAYAGCETPPSYLGLGRPVALLLVSFRRGNSRLSHVPVKPTLHLPCSQTPDGPWHSPLHALGSVPVDTTTKTPSIVCLTRLIHTAFVITVYASCRHLCLLCKTRFRLMVYLCRSGLVTCWVSSKGFNEQIIPLSRVAHGAKCLDKLNKKHYLCGIKPQSHD
jgi:hypothetical protein